MPAACWPLCGEPYRPVMATVLLLAATTAAAADAALNLPAGPVSACSTSSDSRSDYREAESAVPKAAVARRVAQRLAPAERLYVRAEASCPQAIEREVRRAR